MDNAIRFSGEGMRVRTDVSCTVFLADPAEYDGGHAVLYPGTSIHQVTPVTRGYRLACFLWIESMVRSDEQRRLLFDLDMTLMRLRETHGESEEAVALTGTYHNLLRMWADT